MNTAPKRRDLWERLDQLGIAWLCDWLIEGQSIRGIAKELGASAAGILKWLDREPERMRQYQLARQAQADAIVDELIEMADEPVPAGLDGRMDSAAVNDKRLRIDTRKWIASKFRPSQYGDRVEVSADVSTKDERPDQIMARIVAVLATHGLRVTTDDACDQPQLQAREPRAQAS